MGYSWAKGERDTAADEGVGTVFSIAVTASSFMLTSVFLITHGLGFLPVVVVKKQRDVKVVFLRVYQRY